MKNKNKQKTRGIVNCPIHSTKDGDYFPTLKCPDCRHYLSQIIVPQVYGLKERK